MNFDLIRAFIAIFLEGYLFSLLLYFQEKAEREYQAKLLFDRNKAIFEKGIKAMQLNVEWVSCESDRLLKYYKDNAEKIHRYFKFK